jgi:hypothetical protein
VRHIIRTISGIVAGCAFTAALVRLTDELLLIVIQGIFTMPSLPAYYWGVSILIDSLYSMFGGYVCAMIAQENASRAIAGIVVIVVLVETRSQVLLWDTIPHWFGIALFIACPAFTWLGGTLSIRVRQVGEPTMTYRRS